MLKKCEHASFTVLYVSFTFCCKQCINVLRRYSPISLSCHREMGEKYRKEVLSHGGGRPPRTMVEEFLERRVESVSTVKALMMDLDQRKCQMAAALT